MTLLDNYLKHIEYWDNCTKCKIGQCNDIRVYHRGSLPAEILFVGSAPDDIDATLEEPFSGPSGKLIESLIMEVFEQVKPDYPFRICYINAILCVPQSPETMRLRAPDVEELQNCSNRLREFYDLVNPVYVVATDKIAFKALKDILSSRELNSVYVIPNPSAILKQEERGGLDRSRAIEVLRSIKDKLCPF